MMTGIIQYSHKAFKEVEIKANNRPSESDFAIVMKLKMDQYTEDDIIDGIQTWWEQLKRRPILHPSLQ
jgi:hypothetical protein